MLQSSKIPYLFYAYNKDKDEKTNYLVVYDFDPRSALDTYLYETSIDVYIKTEEKGIITFSNKSIIIQCIDLNKLTIC